MGRSNGGHPKHYSQLGWRSINSVLWRSLSWVVLLGVSPWYQSSCKLFGDASFVAAIVNITYNPGISLWGLVLV